MWLKEFKLFALKGRVVDTAIGVTIGIVFGNMINSLINDIIMPPIGLFLSGVDFSQLSVPFHLPGRPENSVEIRYGSFISAVINFIAVTGSIFVVLKTMVRLRFSELEDIISTKNCSECQMTIPMHATKCGHCCSDLHSAHSKLNKEQYK